MVEDPKIIARQSEVPIDELPVYYVKSNFYRVIHADGIYGGGSPTPGNIMMTVFSHRIPLPEQSANDSTGKEIVQKRVVRYGIENELEVSIVLALNTAKIMRQWLDAAINNAEASLRQTQQAKQ